MLKDLIKFANSLDSRGMAVEADMVDRIIAKMSGENPDNKSEKAESLSKPKSKPADSSNTKPKRI